MVNHEPVASKRVGPVHELDGHTVQAATVGDHSLFDHAAEDSVQNGRGIWVSLLLFEVDEEDAYLLRELLRDMGSDKWRFCVQENVLLFIGIRNVHTNNAF